MKKKYPVGKARGAFGWHKHLRAGRNKNVVNKSTRRLLKQQDKKDL